MSLFTSKPTINIPKNFQIVKFTNDQLKPTDNNVTNFNKGNYYRLNGNNPPKRVTAEIGDDGIKHIDVYDSDDYIWGQLNPKYSITSVTILKKVSNGGKSRKQKRGGRKSRKNRRSRKSM